MSKDRTKFTPQRRALSSAIDARWRTSFDGSTMATMDLFDPFNFEKTQNGLLSWHESDLMDFLGYQKQNRRSFRSAVQRAMAAWVSIGNDPGSEFRMLDSGFYKFTRSACYLIAMQCDSKKPQVASAQAYFVYIGNVVQDCLTHASSIERVVIRDEITGGMKSLSRTAKNHGVTNYGMFLNEGYRGMYNMSLEAVTMSKGVPTGQRLIDRMDRTELAAHLFRITQTDQKILNDRVSGQSALETTAYDVGAAVRRTMIDIGGTAPEDLPIAEPIAESKKRLRAADKNMKKLDLMPKHHRMLNAMPEPTDPVDPLYTKDPEDDDV